MFGLGGLARFTNTMLGRGSPLMAERENKPALEESEIALLIQARKIINAQTDELIRLRAKVRQLEERVGK